MPVFLEQQTISLKARQTLLKGFPCFSALSEEQYAQLCSLMREVEYAPYEDIVIENDLVDSVYIIVRGEAEVTRAVQSRRKIVQVPLAILKAGEAIGLNDTGFYSTTGKRTATVTAHSDMLLLRLDVRDLYFFLKKHKLEFSMYAASEQMLRVKLIKQSLPFSNISHERALWLSEHVEVITIPARTVIFNQGDIGDKCYLIRSGQVEILHKDEEGNERCLAVLKAPMLFGEATLITHAPRNAAAKTIDECELLVLRHEYLSELIESEEKTAKMFMTLMVDRSRPIKNSRVSEHKRMTADGQDITILKNPDNSGYFKLSAEGLYIWQQLDGKHTLKDITLSMAEKYNVFAPDIVAALISKLNKSGFVQNVASYDVNNSQSWLVNIISKLTGWMSLRVPLVDADQWVTAKYNRYIRYFFTKTAQSLLAVIMLMGFSYFVWQTQHVLAFFNTQQAVLLFLLAIIPISALEIILHELGHAFAVKACGREVHYMGIGWDGLSPMAFTDTSDMWLSTRGPRTLVNLAGVYVDVLIAGIAGCLMIFIPNMYVQGVLWFFALYTYINAFRMLSPLEELDGYYVLMDWLERPHLRQTAVLWLLKKFPGCLRHPSRFRENWPEVIYWVACLIYLVLVSLLTLLVQNFVFDVLNVQAMNVYVTLILPILAVIFSSISILIEIKKQSD